MKCLICSTRNAMREAQKHPSVTSTQSATYKLRQLRLAFKARTKFPPRCSTMGEEHETVLMEISNLCEAVKNEPR